MATTLVLIQANSTMFFNVSWYCRVLRSLSVVNPSYYSTTFTRNTDCLFSFVSFLSKNKFIRFWTVRLSPTACGSSMQPASGFCNSTLHKYLTDSLIYSCCMWQKSNKNRIYCMLNRWKLNFQRTCL